MGFQEVHVYTVIAPDKNMQTNITNAIATIDDNWAVHIVVVEGQVIVIGTA